MLLRNWLFELLVLGEVALNPLRSANKELALELLDNMLMLLFKETEFGMKGLDWLLGDVMVCMEKEGVSWVLEGVVPMPFMLGDNIA